MITIKSIKYTPGASIRITDHYTNGFAETVYTLEDGTRIFVSYGQKSMRIDGPAKEGE